MPKVNEVIELDVPEELADTLVEGWEGTLEVTGEVDSVKGGKVMLRITSVYPADENEFARMADEEMNPPEEMEINPRMMPSPEQEY